MLHEGTRENRVEEGFGSNLTPAGTAVDQGTTFELVQDIDVFVA
jgi:hypothetical protein